jgi:DNA polymerase (family 10)
MAEKISIINSLEEMAILLEIKGDNPFKIRAYSNAARILQGVSGEIQKLIDGGEITQIKGIGKGIADFISILASGKIPEELEVLRKNTPVGVLDMLKVPGMGPKKVKAVWEKLSIKSLGELEYACKENRLVDLDGFGLKTQEKILSGIEQVKKYSERHLLSDVVTQANELLDAVRKFRGIIRIEIAGSLRRWKETIKDIDILVSADEADRAKIMDQFISLPDIEIVTSKGQTKSSVQLKSGINADLRIVQDKQFPYALHHFTGSMEHNVAMREYARKLKLKMNEYGLFDENGKNIAAVDEPAIFNRLGMDYIPPELRENFGEIEAALARQIPVLIESDDIKGVIHVHSQYSDGLNSIAEMADVCKSRGYGYLVISDHSRSAAYARGLTEEQIRKQHTEIDELNKKMSDFRILKSIESDILADGQLDYDQDILASFDLVIGSIHSRFNMSATEATDRLIRAMRNPYLTIVGHPTGRLLLAREGYPVDMHAVIEAAAEFGVALELNANPHRLDTDWRLLKHARDSGVKISINPDAHKIEGISDIRFGVGIARKGWLRVSDILNCLTADELLKFASRRH